MARFLKNREQVKGQSPGALIFVGTRKMDTVDLCLIDYDDHHLEEKRLPDIRDAVPYKTTGSKTWINVNGLHDAETIGDIGQVFDLHPLVIEDILNTGQRPKMDDYDTYLFIVLKMIRFDKETRMVVNEQLNMVMADRFVLTFQERQGDVFEPVRERLRRRKSRIRGGGTDYLACALMDTVVENYISVIEHIGDQIEDLEEEILSGHGTGVMEKIHHFKRETSFLKKSIRPAREAIFQLLRHESNLIHEKTLPFLKDLEDLIIHAAEAIDTYRDLLTDQLNIHNSVTANRMNDIMKVLTIFAAIFIPLTFIAGVYGTNFKYLPELEYRYSYFIFWGVLIVIAGILLGYFKKKRWF
ncbi:MAG TPA: magnesium/cobalt transporter CorA [Desulfotignum sp.]|jgi:magnesium transporter|nr:magnesium/cobalt transporter CorA [Desulfotignum sp.]